MDFFKDRMAELIAEINLHNVNYYDKDSPSISDAEYDKLYDELRSLEEASGVVLEDSPTKKVGGHVAAGFAKHKHITRLYSLDKCKTTDELREWYRKAEAVVGYPPKVTLEYKYDGLTLNLTYRNGVLLRATTRGDGEIGEDVTEQVKRIKGVPIRIPYKGECEIQGEGIMRLSALLEYNKTTEGEMLKNARNAAAGGIRNLNPDETAKRNLSVIFYNVGYIKGERNSFDSQVEMHNFILENGLYGGEFFVESSDFDDLISRLDDIEQTRPKLDYLIDGAVFKIDNTSVREELGYTEKFPKWAMAFKFKPEEVTTILRRVDWQVSRTGKLNPLAVLDPVDIQGVTVSRATLSNISEIMRKGIKVPSRVLLRRSNDVIPEILGVTEEFEDSAVVEPPKVCPVCGNPVSQDGVFIYCSNKTDCAQQIISKLAHFCEKGAMNIDGLSEKTLEKLYFERGVSDFPDLYELKHEDFSEMEGFKEKRIDNLINAITASKSTTLPSLLYAIGIANIGKKSARVLAQAFPTIDELRKATVEELTALPDFGEIMADGIVKFFDNPSNNAMLDKLFDLGVNVTVVEKKSGVFDGSRVVVTGKMSSMTRNEIEQLIQDNGGEVQSSVGKSTTLLVAGEDAGSKLQKAHNLGIRIIDEATFMSMLNN